MSERFDSDVVIVGSGIAGAIMANTLARGGLRVLVLEAGPRVDRAQAVIRFRDSPTKGANSPYPPHPNVPQPDEGDIGAYYVQAGPHAFNALQTRAVGGTTWHWGGLAMRLHPSDFAMKSRYGVGIDWPIDYVELEPWYAEAEREIGVAGPSSEDWGSPRSGGYPMPEVPPTYLDKAVAGACAKVGLTMAPFPQGRNTVARDGRPACCGNASCVPICPVFAKYDASMHVTKAEHAGARIEPLATAYAVTVGDDGRVTAVRFKRPDGSDGEARAKVFVLAAHTIETPKLLLMSPDARRPGGVANSSDQVGRNLLTQIDAGTLGLSAAALYPYRGPVGTSGVREFRDGPFRRERAAFGMSPSNEGWSRAIGPFTAARELAASGLHGAALARALSDRTSREIALGASSEVLPNPDNRVTLAMDRRDPLGLPRPQIRFEPGQYALQGLDVAMTHVTAVMDALGATARRKVGPVTDSAVMGGTCRMGNDPRQSVVDRNLRAHDHRNLFIVGSATFPTIGTAPPTLTIAALALRTATRILVEAREA